MDKHECWLPKMLGKYMGYKKFAITFGQTAYYSQSKEEVEKDKKWINHENFHKFQYKRDGFSRFLIKYIYYNAKYGYWNNPYEVEARSHENDI